VAAVAHRVILLMHPLLQDQQAVEAPTAATVAEQAVAAADILEQAAVRVAPAVKQVQAAVQADIAVLAELVLADIIVLMVLLVQVAGVEAVAKTLHLLRHTVEAVALAYMVKGQTAPPEQIIQQMLV
jgi:hypothetical protein